MTSFPTPCGEITVQDEAGNAIEFYIRRKENLLSESYLFYGTDYAYPVQTKDIYELYIPANHLEIGKNYRLQIHDCLCEFGGSDQNTVCNYTFKNHYHLSIEAYNPNDEEANPHQYDIDCLRDTSGHADYSGYAFRILDFTFDEIVFPIAWIEHFTEPPAILRFVEEKALLQQFEMYITNLTS